MSPDDKDLGAIAISLSLLQRQRQVTPQAVAVVTAPIDLLPMTVVELILLYCDALSLGCLGCSCRFFGATQHSLVERAAASPARLALLGLTPPLRTRELMTRAAQLHRLETPVPMDGALLHNMGKCYASAAREYGDGMDRAASTSIFIGGTLAQGVN